MRFTRKDNSIYILDEPDTHLNPLWGLNYIDILRDIGGSNSKSHTFIATHDPLLVAGLIKEEIRVLRRGADGKISATQPEESPRGTGIANVITSPLFGLESQLDKFSLEVLRKIYEVSDWEDKSRRNDELYRLKSLVPALSNLYDTPDPYRNIAKEAYKLAQKYTVSSNNKPEEKLVIIQRLAEKLYVEALSGDEDEIH